MDQTAVLRFKSVNRTISTGSGTYDTTSTSYSDVTNLDAQILVNTGSYVRAYLIKDPGTSVTDYPLFQVSQNGTDAHAEILLERDDDPGFGSTTFISVLRIRSLETGSGATTIAINIPPPLLALDTSIPSPGTWYYRVRGRVIDGTATQKLFVHYIALVLEEV